MSPPVMYVDCESEPTRHDKAIPRCSIVQFAIGDEEPRVYSPDIGTELVQTHLDGGGVLVGHNVHYEIHVMGLRVPDWSKVYDTSIRGVLAGAANGQHEAASSGLKDLARPLGITLGGKKTVQLSFGSVYGPGDCTQEQFEYACQDVVATRAVFVAQGGLTRRPDEERQTRLADYVFQMARRGVRVDTEMVAVRLAEAKGHLDSLRPRLVAAGIIQARGPKRDPWRDEAVDREVVQARLAAAGATRLGGTRKKPSKLLAADEEALVASGDPDLAVLADYLGAQKWAGLVGAFDVGGTTIRAWWKPLVSSGRVGCGHPNLTQVPRSGGLRECIIPSPGHKLVAVDFAALEFRVWAATCERMLGWSRAAQTLRSGTDPHITVAAEIVGISLAEAEARYALVVPLVKAQITKMHWSADLQEIYQARQDAKAVNYGCIGGMGPARLAKQFTDHGRPCSEGEADDIIAAWKRTYPEAVKYFAWLKKGWEGDGMYRVRLPWSGRERLAYFPEAANFMIQGGGADVAKEAMRIVTEAGLPLVMLGHDELVVDVIASEADAAGRIVVSACEQAGALVYPEVPWTGQKYEVWDRWPSK